MTTATGVVLKPFFEIAAAMQAVAIEADVALTLGRGLGPAAEPAAPWRQGLKAALQAYKSATPPPAWLAARISSWPDRTSTATGRLIIALGVPALLSLGRARPPSPAVTPRAKPRPPPPSPTAGQPQQGASALSATGRTPANPNPISHQGDDRCYPQCA